MDLEESRTVPSSMAVEYAKSIGALFCETSAKTNEGVDHLFLTIAQRLAAILKANPPVAIGSDFLSNSQESLEPETIVSSDSSPCRC
jgi:Ras family